MPGRWARSRRTSTGRFFTDGASGKIEDLEAEPDVLLTYADEKRQHYVSITGRASTLRDPAKVAELWTEGARVWFPKGPTDPSLALIRVDVDSAEYWDAPSSTMIYIYGYAKAVATGRRPEHVGEQGRVGDRRGPASSSLRNAASGPTPFNGRDSQGATLMRGIFLLVALFGAQVLVYSPALARNGRNAAAVGGVAAGVIGGVLLNQMLQQPAEGGAGLQEFRPWSTNRPCWAALRRTGTRPVEDPAFERMGQLRDACDWGSRRACVRFGMVLGENRARERQWRRNRPDFYVVGAVVGRALPSPPPSHRRNRARLLCRGVSRFRECEGLQIVGAAGLGVVAGPPGLDDGALRQKHALLCRMPGLLRPRQQRRAQHVVRSPRRRP